ncbi:MAG TPA: hypothetical protein VLG50_08145 [Candidatus Saccharimonadales bacterium]|nr:hypothetical protein [Candidatus Saccharimonadales bacterium]
MCYFNQLPFELIATILKPLEPSDWMHVKATCKQQLDTLSNILLLNQMMPFTNCHHHDNWLYNLRHTCKVCKHIKQIWYDYLCYDCYLYHEQCWKCGDSFVTNCKTIHCHEIHFTYCCDTWYPFED